MIHRIQIRNFQKHRKLDLRLGKLNCITGKTDAGKSAILNAVRWVTFNKPAGVSFIHHGKKTASVRIVTDEGAVVRSKSKSKNIYQINDRVYKAFGANVPPDITTLLNLSDINFEFQHDGLFWFSESAGEVSRQLNKIVSLDLIDSTLANLGKDLRQAKTQQTFLTDRIEELEDEYEKARRIYTIEEPFKQLEAFSDYLEKLTKKSARLSRIIKEHHAENEHVERFAVAINLGSQAIKAEKQWAHNKKKQLTLTRLIQEYKHEKTIAERPLEEWEAIMKMGDALFDDIQKQFLLEGLVRTFKETGNEWRRLKGELRMLGKELKDLLKGKCPLCHQEIKQATQS